MRYTYRKQSWVLLAGVTLWTFTVTAGADETLLRSSDVASPEVAQNFLEVWTTPIKLLEVSQPYTNATISDKGIFAATSDGSTVLISLADGARLWETPFGSTHPIFPLLTDTSALIVHEDLSIVALDILTGTKRWEFHDESQSALPAATPHSVLISTRTGLIALDANDGSVSWKTDSTAFPVCTPELLSDACFVGTSERRISAYNITSGNLIWDTPVFDGDITRLAAASGKLFALLSDYTLVALDVRTGAILWSCAIPTSDGVISVTADVITVLGRQPLRNFFGVAALSGEVLWESSHTATLEGPPIIIGNYVLLSSRGNISVLDALTGSVINEIGPETTWVPIGMQNATIYFASSHSSIVAARLNYRNLINPNFATALNTSGNTVSNVFRAAKSLVPFMFALFWVIMFTRFAQPRIPPTHETILRLYTLLLVMITLCLVSATTGAILIVHAIGSASSFESLAFGCALLLPILAFVVCIVIFVPVIRRRIGNATPLETDESQALSFVTGIMDDLCREMGLKRPEVLVGPPRTAPVVFGLLSRRAILVLPRDFTSLVRRACEGDSELESHLIRLILAHELAHIKNGDLVILPLIFCRPWLFMALMVCIALWSTNLVFLHNQSIRYISNPLIPIMIAGWAICYFVLWTLIVERERLADATATLHIPPEMMTRLTRMRADPNESISVLETFVLSITRLIPYSHSFLGLSIKPNRWHRQPRLLQGVLSGKRSIQALMKVLRSRINELTLKKYVLPPQPIVSYIEACLIGFTAALLLLSIRLGKIYAFQDFAFRLEGLPEVWTHGAWLRSWDTWVSHTEQHADFWRPIVNAACVLNALLTSSLLLIPLREMPMKAGRGIRDLLEFGKRFLWCLITYSITVSILDPILPFPRFPHLEVGATSTPLLMLLFVPALFLGLQLRASDRLPNTLLQWEFTFAIGTLGASGVVMMFLFNELPVSSRFLLYWCAMSIVGGILNSRLHCLVIARAALASEGIYFRRLFWRQRSWMLGQATRELIRNGIVRRIGVDIAFAYGVLPLAIATLLYPTLVKVDAQYIADPGIIRDRLRQLADTPVETIVSDRFSFAVQYLPVYFVNAWVGPGRFPPSTAILLFMVGILCVILSLVLTIRAVAEFRSPIRTIQNLLSVYSIENLFGTGLARKSLVATYLPKLTRPLLRYRPYLAGDGFFPLTGLSCQTAVALHAIGGCEKEFRKVAEWVARCEVKEGGFACSPESLPTAWHTLLALRMFRLLSDGKINWNRHVQWAVYKLKALQSAADRMTPMSWLQEFWAALEIADRFGHSAVEPEAVDRTRSIALGMWHQSTKSPVATAYLVGILCRQCGSDDYSIVQIRETWLPMFEQALTTLSPRSDLTTIEAILRIIKDIYPMDFEHRPHVRQTLDTIVKEYAERT